jgi:cold-inducible RNA-binding protein
VSKNLYVGNLSFDTTEADLTTAFGAHGSVIRAHLVTDRETGRSRGFGFVEMADGADAAIAAFNGANFQGRTLTVNEAKPKEDRPRTGGGSGGGYGGGGGGGSRGGYGGGASGGGRRERY